MNNQAFKNWFKGFIDAMGPEAIPTKEQWDLVVKKVEELENTVDWGSPIGDKGLGVPNTIPFTKWNEPYTTPFGKVRYGDICSCNPKNGGSGICGCVMGNELVDKPKIGMISHPISTSSNTNTTITTTSGDGIVYGTNSGYTIKGNKKNSKKLLKG